MSKNWGVVYYEILAWMWENGLPTLLVSIDREIGGSLGMKKIGQQVSLGKTDASVPSSEE